MTQQASVWLRLLRMWSWGVALLVFYLAAEGSKEAPADQVWLYGVMGLSIFALPVVVGIVELIVRKQLGLPRHISE